MKLYLYFSILLILIYVKSDSDCENIKPNQFSDCILSIEDKKKYKYCCYKNDKYGKDCFAFKENEYTMVQSLNDENYYGNDTEFRCNSSSLLKLGILFLIFSLF